MGKNIKFKPCLIKQAYDPEGRKMTVHGPDSKMEEELSIQVEDQDLKITMMWTVEDFQDKLDMMRTGYATYQDQKLSKTYDASLLKTVDKEVFNTRASQTMFENFDKGFMPNPNPEFQ